MPACDVNTNLFTSTQVFQVRSAARQRKNIPQKQQCRLHSAGPSSSLIAFPDSDVVEAVQWRQPGRAQPALDCRACMNLIDNKITHFIPTAAEGQKDLLSSHSKSEDH